MSKTVTISMTDHPPVRVDSELWPIVAEARDWDNEFEFQANRKWVVRVRRHDDGRTVVYGAHDTQFPHEADLHAGFLTDIEGTVAAIRRVADAIGAAEHVAQSCIAGLPPITL